MISNRFDLDEFVAKVRDRNIEEINLRLREEIREAERVTGPHIRGAPERRKLGAPEYLKLLKGLAWSLSTNERPSSVQPWDLPRMRPIFESLVNRGELRPETLIIFHPPSR